MAATIAWLWAMLFIADPNCAASAAYLPGCPPVFSCIQAACARQCKPQAECSQGPRAMHDIAHHGEGELLLLLTTASASTVAGCTLGLSLWADQWDSDSARASGHERASPRLLFAVAPLAVASQRVTRESCMELGSWPSLFHSPPARCRLHLSAVDIFWGHIPILCSTNALQTPKRMGQNRGKRKVLWQKNGTAPHKSSIVEGCHKHCHGCTLKEASQRCR